jgi:hypothetical protein
MVETMNYERGMMNRKAFNSEFIVRRSAYPLRPRRRLPGPKKPS